MAFHTRWWWHGWPLLLITLPAFDPCGQTSTHRLTEIITAKLQRQIKGTIHIMSLSISDFSEASFCMLSNKAEETLNSSWLSIALRNKHKRKDNSQKSRTLGRPCGVLSPWESQPHQPRDDGDWKGQRKNRGWNTLRKDDSSSGGRWVVLGLISKAELKQRDWWHKWEVVGSGCWGPRMSSVGKEVEHALGWKHWVMGSCPRRLSSAISRPSQRGATRFMILPTAFLILSSNKQ